MVKLRLSKTNIERRQKLIRSKVSGTLLRPRLAVHRTNKFIYAQLIDDTSHTTLLCLDDRKMKKGTKVEKASELGKSIAKEAIKLKIEQVVFDRRGYKYHGRVKSLADGVCQAGLKI